MAHSSGKASRIFFSKWENLLIDDLKHSQTPTRSSRSYSYREYWRAEQDINTHKEKMILDELKKIKEIRYDYK